MEPILIVEDEPAIADLIEMTLSPHGYLCQKAQSAEQAADLLDTGRYSAVLLDVMLPGADGFSLMDYLGANDTPVIFVTARTELEDRLRGLRAGAYDYISKPFAPEELLAREIIPAQRKPLPCFLRKAPFSTAIFRRTFLTLI